LRLFAEPRLSSQPSQDLSRFGVFLCRSGRRNVFLIMPISRNQQIEVWIASEGFKFRWLASVQTPWISSAIELVDPDQCGLPATLSKMTFMITRHDLDELAELREEAARACDEAKDLIEESRQLRRWADEFRQKATPLIGATPPAVTVSDEALPQPAAPAHPL